MILEATLVRTLIMLPLLLVAWTSWSPGVFVKAEAEGRLVLLDLGAGWCHWCHVMEEVTYQDPEVVKIIGERFIAVHADADRFPDLAQRYEDYGWPATIVFGPDGKELVKLRGYLPPQRMISMLRAVADDPTPGPSVLPESEHQDGGRSLTEAQRRSILDRYFGVYDRKFGGWGTVHHYVHPESMEYALRGALKSNRELTAMARQTLDANLRLIDPKSGAVYQYSDASKPDDPWGSPHFEKIMQYQASNLRLYTLAHQILGDAEYETAARSIYRYLIGTLRSPEGAFYASQDADSPRLDRHRYARENGWAIAALCAYAGAFADDEALGHARRAAEWIIAHRRRADGTFAHGLGDRRPHLGDDVAMAEALLALHEITQESRWLDLAQQTIAAVDRVYRVEGGGYQTSTIDPGARGALSKPYRQIEENLAAARIANRLGQKEIAMHAMRFLTSPSVTSERRFLIGLLLADAELAEKPVELTVIGAKNDQKAAALYRAVLSLPAPYRTIRRLDPTDPRSTYPARPAPAAYVCAAGACSRPAVNPEELPGLYRSMLAPR